MRPAYRNALPLLLIVAAVVGLRYCKPTKEPVPVNGRFSYEREFNDLNADQLLSAQAHGLDAPLADREGVSAAVSRYDLRHIKGNRYYEVDRLTHSVPYLVEPAALLLDQIGAAWSDSLESHHLPRTRFVVTSLLRTAADQQRLSRSNVNASANSCHCYATTFDITYKRFLNSKGDAIQDEQYKLLLAQVLRDLHSQCHIKYELKQACFHITVR